MGSALGVNEKTVSKWENGWQPPRAARLEAIANVLGVSRDWLLVGDIAAHVGRDDETEEILGDRWRPDDLPHAIRTWLKRFELELTELGATDSEISWARKVVTNAENYPGGIVSNANDPRMVKLQGEMAALAGGVRALLEVRHAHRLPIEEDLPLDGGEGGQQGDQRAG